MHTACDEVSSEPAEAVLDSPAAEEQSGSMQQPHSLLLSAVVALEEALVRDEVDARTQECLKELLPTLTSLW